MQAPHESWSLKYHLCKVLCGILHCNDLLDTTTLELKTFISDIPPYAILSHTSGDDDFLFEHLQVSTLNAQSLHPGRGLREILASKLARGQPLGYAWTDTCCIDKSSSAELSEAIYSMYAWYRGSAAWYAGSRMSHSRGPVLLASTKADGFDEDGRCRRCWCLTDSLFATRTGLPDQSI